MACIEDQITELDRTDGWMGEGMTSCAHWLNLHCGIGMDTRSMSAARPGQYRGYLA